MLIRERTYEHEKLIFSEFASFSKDTKGRGVNERFCEIRTEYQRDRDRIIHSKSFRRLKHKTQVFITPEGDHYRTRLTHTLEVSQIARTIARGLMLNEDLTEAIALGHDLGHTPFGHAGERALDRVFPGKFLHNEQSLRVVEVLEGGTGLNLTYEVKDGILNHRGNVKASTLEGQIVKFADRFAYINHDIDDALRSGILKFEQLPKECIDVLGERHSKRINTLITDIIRESGGKSEIALSAHIEEAILNLRKFMFENVYIDSLAKTEEKKAENILIMLYEYFKKNPQKMQGDIGNMLEKYEVDRVVCDYISGMTDRYALYMFDEIFVPKSWQADSVKE